MFHKISREIIFLFFSVCFVCISQAQIKYYTYFDEGILRSEPSLESDAIINVPIGTQLKTIGSNRRGASKYDTINDRGGNWLNIEYLGHEGYIWEHLVSNQSFITNKGELVLLRQEQNEETVEYRILTGDSLLGEGVLIVPNLYIEGWEINDASAIYELTDVYLARNFSYITLLRINNNQLSAEFLPNNQDQNTQDFGELDTVKIAISNGEHVNIRLAADDSSDVIGQLSNNEIVQFIGYGPRAKLNNLHGNWLKIKKGDQIGYVWDIFVILPEKGFEVLATGEQIYISYRKIYVLNKENELLDDYLISDKTVGNYRSRINRTAVRITHSPFVNKKGADLIINIRNESGEMDVQSTDQNYFIWDGEDVRLLVSGGSYADAGDYECTKYFIVEDSMAEISPSILKMDLAYREFHEGYFNAIEYYGNKGFYSQFSMKMYSYQGDSLIGLTSRLDHLQVALEKDYSDISILNYQLMDFNEDGLLDVVFCAQKKKEDRKSPSAYYLGYARAVTKDAYEIVQMNGSLLWDSYCRKLELRPWGFVLWDSRYVDYDSDTPFIFKKLSFAYSKMDDRFYLNTKRTGTGSELKFEDKQVLLEEVK